MILAGVAPPAGIPRVLKLRLSPGSYLGYGVALGAVGLVSLLIGFVLGQVNLTNVSMLYLIAVMATAVANIEPSTRGRSKGSFASGSARRTSGMTANDSSSRAGPRSSGDSTLAARNRLRSAATLICPSSVRIAQAQAFGPCTSTPLGRAMPPSRTFASLIPPRVDGPFSSAQRAGAPPEARPQPAHAGPAGRRAPPQASPRVWMTT